MEEGTTWNLILPRPQTVYILLTSVTPFIPSRRLLCPHYLVDTIGQRKRRQTEEDAQQSLRYIIALTAAGGAELLWKTWQRDRTLLLSSSLLRVNNPRRQRSTQYNINVSRAITFAGCFRSDTSHPGQTYTSRVYIINLLWVPSSSSSCLECDREMETSDLWNLNWNDTNFWHSDMQLKLNLRSSGWGEILYPQQHFLPLLCCCSTDMSDSPECEFRFLLWPVIIPNIIAEYRSQAQHIKESSVSLSSVVDGTVVGGLLCTPALVQSNWTDEMLWVNSTSICQSWDCWN